MIPATPMQAGPRSAAGDSQPNVESPAAVGFLGAGRVADQTAAPACISAKRLPTRSSQVLSQPQHARRNCGAIGVTRRLRSTSLFTEKERAALEWSEAVTSVSRSRVPDGLYTAIRGWFTDIEIVKHRLPISSNPCGKDRRIRWKHYTRPILDTVYSYREHADARMKGYWREVSERNYRVFSSPVVITSNSIRNSCSPMSCNGWKGLDGRRSSICAKTSKLADMRSENSTRFFAWADTVPCGILSTTKCQLR